MRTRRALILGAAGRDFHNFNVFFRENLQYKVVAFTATQIPFIENRTYPPHLAGERYSNGVPIFPEERLEEIVGSLKVDDIFFSYSDIPHAKVMHLASRALALGTSFHLLGPSDTMLHSNKPVIAVTASRTGAGKSTVVRRIVRLLSSWGVKCVTVRHPMPYGGFEHPVQRFGSEADLDRYKLSLEEREEYEALISEKVVTYAGVDYGQILVDAEKEAPLIIWDGGNNDFPFFKPDLHITVVDALRPGDEVNYHPGHANFMMADIIAVNKVNAAPSSSVEKVLENCKSTNPRAKIMLLNSEPQVDSPELVKGKRVLVVEDGPTVTHGEMKEAGGAYAARLLHASIVDPRPYAVGYIRDALLKYSAMGPVLPALGYSLQQLRDLEETINATDCECVLIATPARLEKMININKPTARVSFEVSDAGSLKMEVLLREELLKLGLLSS